MLSAPVSVRTRPNHVPALDGVRLLAVGLVILHHTTSGSHASFLLRLLGLQNGAGIGPPLFFVLSGALLTNVLIDARNTPNRYGNFLLRRVLRIIPLYFAYLLLAIVGTWIASGHPPQDMWVYFSFLQNTFVHTAEDTGSHLPMYHLWTIAVQDQFYLVWPLLLWRCTSDRQRRILCWSGIAYSLLARILFTHPAITPELMGRSLPACAGAMCLGGLLAIERRNPTRLTPILRRSFLPLVLLCGVWMWHGLNFESPLGSTVGLQLVGFACAALISSAMLPSSWTARILGSRLIAHSGKHYAFGMYIFHPWILDVCMHLSIPSKALRLALFLVTTLVVAGLSYRFYESPFLHMKLGRNPSPRLRPRTSDLASLASVSENS